MKIHEYQARQLLNNYGIPASKYHVVRTPEEAREAFKVLANPFCIAKVMVLMGGRGKAGGVKRVQSAEEAANFVTQFIDKPFSTPQSAGEARPVRSILISEDKKIHKEYYLGVVIDRTRGLPVVLFSKEGGVDIEEVAAKDPGAILKVPFSPSKLPSSEDIARILQSTLKDPAILPQVANIGKDLARLFIEKDASVCEINPLALCDGSRVFALDAKIVFDDNALFRHSDVAAMKDPDEEDAREKKAKSFNLSYVSMNGNIGCLVNGAGLAMATMDMIKLSGGEPANFLDVGGGANADQVREAFKIILEDSRVEAILVNIFGGIMKCDVIAQGVIEASRQIGLQVPLIVRLEGTHVEEGRALLTRSGLKLTSTRTIEEAANAAVRLARSSGKPHVHTH